MIVCTFPPLKFCRYAFRDYWLNSNYNTALPHKKNCYYRVYPENRNQDPNDWTYKETYSNHRNGFYSEIYTKDNKVIFVFRGTEIHSGVKETTKDIMSDFQMGLSYLPYQIKDAENAYLKTINKYGKENVVLTGHSLGGSEAQILGAKYGAETITFAAYGTKNLFLLNNIKFC